MRPRRAALRGPACILACLAACGCATLAGGPDGGAENSEESSARRWLRARGRDLAESFDLALHLGPGLGARVTATHWLQAGLLSVGPSEAHGPLLEPVSLAVGVRDGEVGAWDTYAVEFGLSPWYRSDAVERPAGSRLPARRFEPAAERGSELSAQAHLALIGIELGFDPVAFGFFVAGLFGHERVPDDATEPADPGP